MLNDMRFLNVMVVALFVCLVMVLIQPYSASAEEKTLKFSWDVSAQSVIDSQGITELRVYQDTWSQLVNSTDPLAGTIEVTANLSDDPDVCNWFWATHATPTDESAATGKVKVCKDIAKVDPDPASPTVVLLPEGLMLVVPPGYTATIESSVK